MSDWLRTLRRNNVLICERLTLARQSWQKAMLQALNTTHDWTRHSLIVSCVNLSATSSSCE